MKSYEIITTYEECLLHPYLASLDISSGIGDKNMTNVSTQIASDAFKPLEQINIPTDLKSLVDRHYQNILNLSTSLLLSGKSEEEVRSAIKLICGSFEAELFNTIKSIAENEVANAK